MCGAYPASGRVVRPVPRQARLRERRLSLERRSVKAREPLAQFPGFDADEPFRSPCRRQAVQFDLVAGLRGRHAGVSLGRGMHAPRAGSARILPELGEIKALHRGTFTTGRNPVRARGRTPAPNLFRPIWTKCALVQRGVHGRPSPKEPAPAPTSRVSRSIRLTPASRSERLVSVEARELRKRFAGFGTSGLE